jgi:hypothetical protein
MLDLNTIQNFGLTVACDDDGSVLNTFRATSKHYVITSNQFRGNTIGPGQYGPATKKVTITAGSDTVYLPFWQNNISSVVLPTTGPTLFITDNLSGCCVYIGQKADGSLVAFHANSELKSTQSDLTGRAANFQHDDTLKELDRLALIAKAEANVTKIVGGCGKALYNQAAANGGATSDSFLGGTTVVGFRDPAQGWSFYYQTWGSISGSAVRVLDCKKFYPA